MEPTRHHSSDKPRPFPEIQHLLQRHVDDPSDERAFTEIVHTLQRLVHQSVLRRSGDVTLAEDVTQTVFSIMARKARALCKHPSTLSWVFQTTKLETLQAMRAVRRQHRKKEAFQEIGKSQVEPSHDLGDLLDESLDQLTQGDRELVLQKYYEGRSYAELSAQNGKSEAANKMRIKRALGTLSGWLSRQGAHLSVAAIGASLTTEFAKASSMPAVKSLTAASLAASPNVTSTTLITNIISTMNTTKSITAAALAATAIIAIPYAVQSSSGRSLDQEITDLQSHLLSLDEQHLETNATLPKPSHSPPVKTVGNALKRALNSFDSATFMSDISRGLASGNNTEVMLSILPVLNLSPSEIEQALKDLSDTDGDEKAKKIAHQMLSMMSNPGESPAKLLDQQISAGVESHLYRDLLQEWAARDPQAALDWLNKRIDDGDLHQKGLRDSPQQALMRAYISGLATKHPNQAIEMFHSLDHETQLNSASRLAYTLHSAGPEHALTFIQSLNDAALRKQALPFAVSKYAETHSPTDAIAWISSVDPSHDELHSIHSSLVSKESFFGGQGLQQRIDWLEKNSPERNAEGYMKDMVNGLFIKQQDELRDWLSQQTTSSLKDQGVSALVRRSVADNKDGIPNLIPLVVDMQDQPLQEKILQNVYRHAGDTAERKQALDQAYRQAGLNPDSYSDQN